MLKVLLHNTEVHFSEEISIGPLCTRIESQLLSISSPPSAMNFVPYTLPSLIAMWLVINLRDVPDIEIYT
jgi:hypothetical protein